MVRHNLTLTSPIGRLVLVAPTAQDDEDAIAKLQTHPETLRYRTFSPRTMTSEEVAAKRERRLDDPRRFDFNVFTVDGAHTLVAMTCLKDVDEEHNASEAGITVHPEVHRTGLGTEVLYTLLRFAFEEKKLHRVQFQTNAINAGMRGWLDHAAEAHCEGVLRHARRALNGNYEDVAVYSILEDEWREKTRAALLKRMKVEDYIDITLMIQR
ncbi:acyl-CoA N-acyltransferase [Schizophyllum amplum]|uniref:Acyl-CoA N-acyltransferase n=1 Tax=Schizophyllum amplum TaxID=97359 RepID=A0A550CVT8_9AGAR|nr:acyl-CoA N-acyltransferase [Auriculariopsis ampla]